MQRVSTTLIAGLFLVPFLLTSPAGAQLIGPDKVITAERHDVSPPLSELARAVPEYHPGIPDYEIRNEPSIYAGAKDTAVGVDPVLQSSEGNIPLGPTIKNWEGIGRSTGGGGTPPDTNGDVGPNHYFQTVNTSFRIWNKNGVPIAGPTPNNAVWSGFGGSCEFQNAGDPVVMYDPLADRWVLSQFTSPGGSSATQCFAVSVNGDPTGSYFRYQFPTPGNDYPKFSVWSDAYYAGIRNFAGGFQFDAYAFERAKMLVGGEAKAVVFNMSALLGGVNNFLPADVDGTTPPPNGTPGLFIGVANPSIVQNDLKLFTLTTDWPNPANSALEGPISIPTAAYNGNVCNFNRSCIPQPGTTRKVDGFADAMMHRLAYRNFGTHQSIVCAHTVDVGDFSDHAGIRWHELRNTGSGWTLFQEGTYSPDSDYRWMPSIAQNANGDIMVAYSVSSKTTSPSLRYVGRQSGDPLGQMTFAEGLLIAGSGSQTGLDRWGDYAAMDVDPGDETTFWFTSEYYQTSSSSGWQTRVASMQADTAPPRVDIVVDPFPGSPVVVPIGQSRIFGYSVEVHNNTIETLNAKLWNTITVPGGEEVGPVQFKVQNISVPANSTYMATFDFEFPPAPKPGTYIFNIKVGGYPNVQLDRDTFLIIRPSSSPTGSGAVADRD